MMGILNALWLVVLLCLRIKDRINKYIVRSGET